MVSSREAKSRENAPAAESLQRAPPGTPQVGEPGASQVGAAHQSGGGRWLRLRHDQNPARLLARLPVPSSEHSSIFLAFTDRGVVRRTKPTAINSLCVPGSYYEGTWKLYHSSMKNAVLLRRGPVSMPSGNRDRTKVPYVDIFCALFCDIFSLFCVHARYHPRPMQCIERRL